MPTLTPVAFGALGRSSIDSAQVSVANANRDGTGTLVDLKVAAGNGSYVTRVDIQSIQTTTAGMIRLFLYNGATSRLIGEIPVSAITVGANTPAFTGVWVPPNGILNLPSGYKLQGSTHNGETFNLTTTGGDY